MAHRLHIYTQRTASRGFRRSRSRHFRARLALVVSLALFIIGYVGIMNDVATQGYRLQDLQQQRDRLQQDNQRLQLSISESESLSRVATLEQSTHLQPVAVVEYVSTASAAVAVR